MRVREYEPEAREQLIAAETAKGLVLVRDEIHADGRRLVFAHPDDIAPEPEPIDWYGQLQAVTTIAGLKAWMVAYHGLAEAKDDGATR